MLYARELASQSPVLTLLLSCALVVPVREVGALERIPLEVIHLPLIGDLAVGVVVPGEFVTLLADADHVVGWPYESVPFGTVGADSDCEARLGADSFAACSRPAGPTHVTFFR